ncbi:hypothetical protein E8E15_005485 [Penicillium rubens]|uniref:uncharacterized protein n=1 Tax=Penicillium rubens TaxID=1108849 RepID=UPI001E0283DB|nr:uncharacterized protein N7525_003850 [Penicillium rubens]KAF3017635.1 hypothetical protein E8E15_005485 [Penicillium rubens]KAJ5045312.1 hypothetical protein NUH16_002127 [Penicillium rubens]KAJ5838662.1 hypothetical protein N7525_003850 [Penicillium rubens]KAJ5866712.1 hypothetical protein N7534_001265 [Penicillium rubens]
MSRLYHIYNLLILISILCQLPAWAQSVEPTTLTVPRSAWHASGETTDRRSPSTEETTTVRRRTIVTATDSTTTGMPKPFDTLSYNFANASTCIDFFAKWRANTTISNCNAISLLIENSNAFFHTLSSAPATSRILDKSCSADVSKCASIMTGLAADLLDPDNCGDDYENGNSVVKGTYRDLVAYEPMYRATCLMSPSTQKYCFVDAVSNSTAPDDYGVYLVPLGTPLTVGSVPTCNKCLKETMDIYSGWARRDGQPLDTTYLPSAKIVNAHCGDGFAATNITLGSVDVRAGAGLAVPLPHLGFATVMALVLGPMLIGLF